MTADRSAPAVDDADLVNGPEDVLVDWDEVEWRRVEQDVRRLRQRIFTASQAGDLKRVRNPQSAKADAPVPR
ncbi:MAG TPA: reverse transcriptase N-terminal domain-containing protein [Candidatus Limnocylindrales bacterium]|nr:reverse transcriptase N-terminal domain-containing protein [Candidatus Limnocylindrales bacterium]